MTQLLLALFGLAAVYMSMVSTKPAHRRLAPVVGLAGQPFWLYATASGGQWGMFALCCCYTVLYARGAWNAWRGT
jgi:hypothetical protein